LFYPKLYPKPLENLKIVRIVMNSIDPGSQSIYNQSAAIPYFYQEGKPKIVLITTHKNKKWIIPKGIIEPVLTPQESAAKEAFEEAGLRGEVNSRLHGTYEYEKWGGTCEVKVYLMEVNEILDEWPEGENRERKFFTPEEAMKNIQQEDLRELIQQAQHYLEKS